MAGAPRQAYITRMSTLAGVGPELPGIARAAIAAWLRGDRPVVSARDAPAAPVFVTLRDPDGALRGCIGTTVPTEPDVAAETARSAVLAAARDPRFPPLEADELAGVHIEVSVLLPEEPVTGEEELDPARYGVVVRDGLGRQGLLLPDVPGIDDARAQVAIARRKGGIDPHAPARITRFEVLKFVEPGGRAAARQGGGRSRD